MGCGIHYGGAVTLTTALLLGQALWLGLAAAVPLSPSSFVGYVLVVVALAGLGLALGRDFSGMSRRS